MNRQIVSLLSASLLFLVFASTGCDLGTYNARFKERNKPKAEASADTENGDAAKEDSDDDSDS